MKTRLTDLAKCGLAPFAFAGMQFPKHLWTLRQGPLAARLKDRKNPRTGDYYHAPTPILGRDSDRGISFYLDSDGAPGLRWSWCDEVDGVRIRHKGWYTDDDGFGEKIRGIVLRLPSSRGFLAGWSMGKDMISSVEYSVYSDITDACHAADSMAEHAAAEEREYQAAQAELDADADAD